MALLVAASFTLTSLLSKAKAPLMQADTNIGLEIDSTTSTSTSHLQFGTSAMVDQAPTFGQSSLLDESACTSESPPSDSIRATSFNGKTIFLKKRKRSQPITNDKYSVNKKVQSSTPTTSKYSGLLDAPIHRLLDNLSANLAQNLQHTAPETSTEQVDVSSEDTLWVDRYRPTCFTDLIGNDRVARETMAWVKQWDYCVFGKKKGKKRQRDEDENFNADDEYHRPREKMLLLSGPPGLGKTTLAHIVARHAGYDVVEINASDARGGNVINDRIRPTLESGSSVNGTKPVLVIIDEIDGATGAGDNTSSFIHNLVQFTQNTRGKKTLSRTSSSGLMPIKYDLRVQQTSILFGAYRRYAAMKSSKQMYEPWESSWLWREVTFVGALIHYSPLTKKRVKDLALTEEQESRYINRLSFEIEGSGKDAAIANGCFEHYATLRQHDANFSRYESGNEWLITYDLLSSSMFADGDFALLSYLPFTLVPFYPLFQARSSQRIERNYSDWEHHQVTKSNEEIYESFARCLRSASLRCGGAYRHLVTSPTLQLEFTPLINRIISPPLRPVNRQVIRPEERLLLERLVEIMAALELRFVQDRAEDGQLSYRLDPPIDVFITYDAKRANDIAPSRYAIRHLVATEVDTKLAAKDFNVVELEKGGKRHVNRKITSGNTEAEVPSERATKRQKTAPLALEDRTPTDFFGRAITVNAAAKPKSAAQKQTAKSYRVSYKFNEGNSAAVHITIIPGFPEVKLYFSCAAYGFLSVNLSPKRPKSETQDDIHWRTRLMGPDVAFGFQSLPVDDDPSESHSLGSLVACSL
ncbi:hypothetical protein AGABI1DRAFT_89230 [Agaricus bisporus var. burnettii JB137-S8]|uniref:AAA+ ATPase domain-containing protein n=1 Tax=Agaricus bisporus var. burnettii (strain JB137-S8 / ATCC MYA-4627 / FGSC 10392) TaxID=597362 RepID=K5Y3A3_AGABU|nr:uncharacterized protein AGABI1DRAFT_89230 [Agaricus bisporus var. burnettii JB137-S8]EKM82410.1 hypothetical protein AGABI1DRAFT_89230 [Agaricus bisporus var. burnettii JB137-S8]